VAELASAPAGTIQLVLGLDVGDDLEVLTEDKGHALVVEHSSAVGLRRARQVLLGASVEALAQKYREMTTLSLADLPVRPNYIFCATDMSFAVNWEFARGRMGDYKAGYTPPRLTLADAVAASSCFPPVFGPMRIPFAPDELKGGEARRQPDHAHVVAKLGLSDGGVYDNRGLEPVWKWAHAVLVSDGGSAFSFEPDSGPIWRLKRYTAIVARQARAVRVRWFQSLLRDKTIPEGAYCGIGTDRETGGYSPDLVDEVIARIRTDLDPFSPAEQDVLENHGYFVADEAIRRRLADRVIRPVEPAAPNPAWLEEAAVRVALLRSAKRNFVIGRF
jgi:NTE family protein